MLGLRDHRVAFGLTQAELARRAHVSRQLLGAVEAGRHIPSVDAALRIAGVLCVPVEVLFGTERYVRERIEPVTDDLVAPLEGHGVTIGRVGHTVVWGVQDPNGDETWPVPDAMWRSDRPTLFPDVDTDALVVAGCDPALGLAAELLIRRGLRVMRQHASTGVAVDALAYGRLHAAVVHGPPGALPAVPADVRCWRLGAWQVGLAYEHRRPSWSAVASGRTRVAQRDHGAASQESLDRFLVQEGLPRQLRGPVAAGHIDAARYVRFGTPAAVTMEPAAAFFDLRFVPIEVHTVELWINQAWCVDTRVEALLGVFASGAFRDRVGSVGGYELCESPELVTMRAVQ